MSLLALSSIGFYCSTMTTKQSLVRAFMLFHVIPWQCPKDNFLDRGFQSLRILPFSPLSNISFLESKFHFLKANLSLVCNTEEEGNIWKFHLTDLKSKTVFWGLHVPTGTPPAPYSRLFLSPQGKHYSSTDVLMD